MPILYGRAIEKIFIIPVAEDEYNCCKEEGVDTTTGTETVGIFDTGTLAFEADAAELVAGCCC